MKLNRLDGHPYFIVRFIGVLLVAPFVLTWERIKLIWSKRR